MQRLLPILMVVMLAGCSDARMARIDSGLVTLFDIALKIHVAPVMGPVMAITDELLPDGPRPCHEWVFSRFSRHCR